MRKSQSPKRSARAGIFARAAISLPIIQANDSIASRLDGSGLRVEHFINISTVPLRLGGFVAGEVLAVPVQDRSGRGLTTFERKESLDNGVGVAAQHAAAQE